MSPAAVPSDEAESESFVLDKTNDCHGFSQHNQAMHPRLLTRWKTGNVLSLVLDLAILLTFCLFLAYGIAVKAYEGTTLQDSTAVKLLQRSSTLVSHNAVHDFIEPLLTLLANNGPQSIQSYLLPSWEKLSNP
jgi:hypothetical protein